MAKFNEMDAEELAKLASKAGKASAEARLGNDKTFEDVVKENMTNQDLKDLYKGLLASGKKGNVKAVETLLRYLEDRKEKETTLDEFLND